MFTPGVFNNIYSNVKNQRKLKRTQSYVVQIVDVVNIVLATFAEIELYK